MKLISLKTFVGLSVLFMFLSCEQKKKENDQITVIGEMKNVMWKGQLQGTIDLDTISNRKNLYGFGPVEYLSGELLIIDGRSYKSSVLNDSTMKVEETFDVKAPFFAFAHIPNWKQIELSNSITSLETLEKFLKSIQNKSGKPFFFKVTGNIDYASFHIVNLPKGKEVHSPDDAHTGITIYEIERENVDLIGFYSSQHKRIFTHHDTDVHIHLITKNRQKMGHLEEVEFNPKQVKLYVSI